jgi:hypothetical protein
MARSKAPILNETIHDAPPDIMKRLADRTIEEGVLIICGICAVGRALFRTVSD